MHLSSKQLHLCKLQMWQQRMPRLWKSWNFRTFKETALLKHSRKVKLRGWINCQTQDQWEWTRGSYKVKIASWRKNFGHWGSFIRRRIEKGQPICQVIKQPTINPMRIPHLPINNALIIHKIVSLKFNKNLTLIFSNNTFWT